MATLPGLIQTTDVNFSSGGIPGSAIAAATGAVPGVVTLSGDIGGTATSLLVVKLRGAPLANIGPASGQVLAFNGTSWIPTTMSGAVTFVDLEVPSGLVNGINTSYTLAFTPSAGSLHLFLNGVLLFPGLGNDYTLSANTILMGFAPKLGSRLAATYRR